MKRIVSLLLIAIIVLSLAACGNVDIPELSDTGITDLKFLRNDTINLEAGKIDSGFFTVEGTEDFSVDDITFISSDENVATFSYDKTALSSYVYYKITAIAPGTATIYAQTVDGIVKTEEITVNVTEGTAYDFTLDFEEKETATETIDLSEMSVQERIEYETQKTFKNGEIEVVYSDHTKYTTIKVNLPSLLSVELDTKSMQLNISNTLKAIDDIEDITVSFSITFPSTDDYGNTHIIKMISAEFSPETRSKINWDGFDWRKIDDIADKFNAHEQIDSYIQ